MNRPDALHTTVDIDVDVAVLFTPGFTSEDGRIAAAHYCLLHGALS